VQAKEKKAAAANANNNLLGEEGAKRSIRTGPFHGALFSNSSRIPALRMIGKTGSRIETETLCERRFRPAKSARHFHRAVRLCFMLDTNPDWRGKWQDSLGRLPVDSRNRPPKRGV
jgi:hypothetical protein